MTDHSTLPLSNFYESKRNSSIFQEKNQSVGRRLRREAMRFKRQLGFALVLRGYRNQQKLYDKDWRSHVKIHAGQGNFTGRVAILVLYQPNGVSQSTLESCAFLAEQGFSVFAISNCALSDADCSSLARSCWRYADRPNYGYDAGAYRDAVRLVHAEGVVVTEMLLINDSIWFPLGEGPALLKRLAEQPDGFGGLVRKAESGADAKSRKEPAGFVEAYFYCCKGPLLAKSGLFWKIWKGLWLTPGREHLKEGMVSYLFRLRRHELKTLCSRRVFLAEMKNRPCAFLHKTLKYGAYTDIGLAREGDALIKAWSGHEDARWKAQALDHVRRTVAGAPFYLAFVYASQTAFDLAFLKKSSYPKSIAAIRAYLAAVDAEDLPAASETVMKEMRATVKQWQQ